LELKPKLEGLPGFRADALIGHTVFEVLADPRDLRRVRSAIMELAKSLTGESRFRGVLILDEPQIGDERLREEWLGIESLFRPEVMERITLVVRRENFPELVMGSLTAMERNSIAPVIERARERSTRLIRRPSEAFFEILRVLLVHWFRKSGPMTSKELAEETGFSYPTIANALERLEPTLHRHSDRRIELSAFPKEAWFKLVAQADKARSSQGFMDPSGRPRSPEVLLDRLRELDRDDIAVAGIPGARHYLPGLDLTGTPRLGLVVHARPSGGPPTFLRRLDPALKPAGRGEPCQVVVHTLFRPESFFSTPENGIRWADEVECLLDLHEMRLESQALEFVERLSPKPNS
jgi:hypothetical protein